MSGVISHARKVYVLTPAEQRVLACIERGLTQTQTADELGVAVGTVKMHTANIRSKRGVTTTRELAAAGAA
jgi:DNA-binding CsgD family transcriptional regulator